MMAGRHLWPPSCRAVGAVRSPTLLVGKVPCLPSHRHHHHQQLADLNPPPQIKCPSFLGLGMMRRELKAGDWYIGSPSCGNIPTRQPAATALPVKEPNNGHVTSDGGDSPYAGTPPPSDGGGFTPAGALSPTDGGCPPSAGPSSPESWPHPSSLRKVAKIAAFLGVAMLQRKVPGRLYFRPSPSFPVAEEAGVVVHQVASDGLLVPVHRPDLRLHQQRRPLLATAGSLPSPAGYCSAPATPPRCCSGAIRHGLVVGGFFPSTGLHNAAPAKLEVFTLLFVLS